jgi:hypothetical protein
MGFVMELGSRRRETELRLRQELQSGDGELRADLEEEKKKWDARLAEYYQQLDRFL